MHEIVELVRSALRGLWAYRWWGLSTTVMVGAVGAIVVLLIPNQYEASARVYVDTQSVLRPLMSGLAVQPNADQQIAMISRTLVSRPNVERVVRMADLDLRTSSPVERDAMVDRLMSNIKFASAGGTNLYTITYRADQSERARKVVQSFLSIFVESNLGDNRRDNDQARRFIEDQIKVYEQRLAETENALKEFKIRNLAAMPSLNQDAVGRASEIGGALAQARMELAQAENARDELRKQLAVEQPTIAADDRGFGMAFGTGASGQLAPSRPQRSEYDDRIDGLRRRIDELKLRYTDQHPDVIAARRVLEQLESARETERKAEAARVDAAAKAAPAAKAARAPGTTANPVYQQLRVSLAESEASVASLRARVREYESRAAALQASAVNAPRVEAEYKALTRDYDITKRSYEQLVSRRESVALSEQMGAASGIGEFRVVDPPRAAPDPVFPNRPLLLGVLLALSIGAGAAAALVRDQLRPTHFDLRSLRASTGLPVFGTVSLIVDADLRNRARRGVIAFSGSAVIYLVVFAALLVWAWLRQPMR
jgi:polysaccharide chain length determinant protein (PEP-CTERM system associated)